MSHSWAGKGIALGLPLDRDALLVDSNLSRPYDVVMAYFWSEILTGNVGYITASTGPQGLGPFF
ncbi:hypothetical protein J6590_045554 [Homalodisca vitripennis]|nr:hypothetical protein J6590_045554 [Homalodisca vitripennis]